MHWSSQNGHLEVVAYLIDSGANVNATTDKHLTPFIYGSENGHFEVVKLLVRRNAFVNQRTITRYGLCIFTIYYKTVQAGARLKCGLHVIIAVVLKYAEQQPT